jgi:subtilase family serine protease
MAPDVGVDITFLEDPKAGKWTKAVVRVSNQGTGPAKSVSVQLRGPIEVKGGRFLPLVSPGKTERFGVEICPRSSGKLAITLVLEAKSQLTDEDCGYEGEFEMRVI